MSTDLINDYFLKVADESDTRLWVNNPTAEEAEKAMAHGAIACTTNPTHAARMLKTAPDVAGPIVKGCVEACETDADAADLVQQKLVGLIAEQFRPLYDNSDGTQGWVSIQGDPHHDDDAAHILAEARRYRQVAPNVIPKIPATAALN